MNIKVRFIPITELAYEPQQMTPGSAGYDLRSPRDYVLPPKERIFIPTDLMTQMPPRFHGIILSILGPALSSHVHAAVGLIDGDYRGNIGILLYNLHQHMPFYVAWGMRIAQIIFQQTVRATFVKVVTPFVDPSALYKGNPFNEPPSMRGSGGFGSTGIW